MTKEVLNDLTKSQLIDMLEKYKRDNKNLEYLLDNMHIISWEFDIIADSFNYVSANVKKILGYDRSEWIDFESWKSMIYNKDREDTVAYCEARTKEGKNHSIEYRVVKKNGDIVWVQDVVTVSKNEEGIPTKLHGFILDINKQKNTTLRLEQEHAFTQSVINNIPDPVMVINNDYSISLMNNITKKKLEHIKLLDPSSPKCYEVSHHRSTPCDSSEHPCPLKEVVQSSKATTVVHNHINLDGSSHYVELAATPLFDDNNECIGIIESARDITTHIRLTDELRDKSNLLDYQAHHDSLTNLPNRVLFNDRLEHGIETCKRHNGILALLFIDLDYFKDINDTLGHLVGDEVLKVVANRIKSTIREQDTLSRLGGDEFTIIMEDIEHVEYASILAGKIVKILKEPFFIDEHKLYISCSLGISIYPNDNIDAQELLKYADIAMYEAKNRGRNNFQYYSKEMTQLVVDRLSLESQLREAIENKEFVLHYQPQYNGKTQEIIGLEALIRWENDELGLIPPLKFIPLAEETGLIREIDNWVMDRAMRDVSELRNSGLNPGKLSLNLAMKQLESDNYISLLMASMDKYGFKSSWLQLEILERNIMTNPDKTMKKLNKLKSLGISISIDDFGTGYSSLAYLKRFEIHEIKIDRSFVTNMVNSNEEKSIVKAIIALSKALNINILAEGVETKEELDFMLQNECYNIQGYYFSKPVSVNEIKLLLAK